MSGTSCSHLPDLACIRYHTHTHTHTHTCTHRKSKDALMFSDLPRTGFSWQTWAHWTVHFVWVCVCVCVCVCVWSPALQHKGDYSNDSAHYHCLIQINTHTHPPIQMQQSTVAGAFLPPDTTCVCVCVWVCVGVCVCVCVFSNKLVWNQQTF